jgi:WD40 repeat protein
MPKVAFAPDGRSLFTARDQTVCRWDVQTGKPLSCMSGELGTIQSIRVNSDGNVMALGGDGQVFVYSTGIGDTHLLLGDTDSAPASLGFSANGLHLLVGRQHGYDTWNVSGGARESHDFTGERVLDFSQNGKLLATTDQSHKILVRDRSTGELQQKLDGHRRLVVLAQFSRLNRYLVTGAADKNVRIWDLSARRQYWSIDDLQSPVAALAISPGETHIAVAERGSSTGIYRIKSRTVVGYFDQPATAVDYAARDILATGGRDQVIRMWEGHSGKMLGIMYGHEDVITALRFTKDAKRLASASADGTVRLWDPHSGIELLRFDLEGGVPRMLAFGPGDRQLAVVDSEGLLHIWDRQRVWSPARNEWLSVADLATESQSE